MTRPQDQDARERAANPRESFHLEAPAGSGKTAVLLARFLTLLAGVSESPREILTLTFTRKAAGEFRERVMQYFWNKNDLGANPPPTKRPSMNWPAGPSGTWTRKTWCTNSCRCRKGSPSAPFTAFAPSSSRPRPMRPASPWNFSSWRMTGQRNGRSRRPWRSCAAG